MPTLSVIIPAKNEAAVLPGLLAQLKLQSRQPDQLIVADAGSQDATAQIARAAGATVVPGGLPGPGRNAGAKVATGDILLFLDADALIEDRQFLERGVAEFTAKHFDLATLGLYLIGGSQPQAWAHSVYNWYVRLVGGWIPHAAGICIFVKREFFWKLGGFDETVIFCEDHNLAIRAAKVGKYGFLKTIRIGLESRRLERDGNFGVLCTYLLAELHTRTIGPIRHHWFRYGLDHQPKDEPPPQAKR